MHARRLVACREQRKPAQAIRRPIDPPDIRAFGRKLRSWYRRNARDLPWRRTREPTRCSLSELMLQQTQVSRVVTRYGDSSAIPDAAHVARAKPAQVMEAWEGLGYYARARNLHRARARGHRPGSRRRDEPIPADPEALRALPGIGAYTAGAVASFAYERRAALVDTNVARVSSECSRPTPTSRRPRAEGGVGDRRADPSADRPNDVDAQPGADGARGAGVYGAGGAL